MKIRTVDSKNRVTITADGSAYSEHVAEDGTITLTPITIPRLSTPFQSSDMQGVYVSVAHRNADPSTITIRAAIPGLQAVADLVTELTEKLSLPAIIRATGVGYGVADLVERQSSQQVINVYK